MHNDYEMLDIGEDYINEINKMEVYEFIDNWITSKKLK